MNLVGNVGVAPGSPATQSGFASMAGTAFASGITLAAVPRAVAAGRRPRFAG